MLRDELVIAEVLKRGLDDWAQIRTECTSQAAPSMATIDEYLKRSDFHRPQYGLKSWP